MSRKKDANKYWIYGEDAALAAQFTLRFILIGCLCLKQPPNWAWNPIRSAHIGVTLVRRFVTKWRVNNMIAFKELLVRAKRGEEKAFEELFEQFEPLVRKCSYMNGHTDEDLRQILLMEFVQAIRKFKI